MTFVMASHKKSLSRLLAEENINVEVDVTAPTAAFDLVNRNMILPNWSGISEPLLDMLIVHEIGHALNTPTEKWLEEIKAMAKAVGAKDLQAFTPVIQSYLNIVEDVRIDKLQKRRYPGTKRDYLLGYKELNDRDLFGLKKNNTDIKKMDFIDRMNIFFKGGADFDFDFNAQELAFIKEAELLETWEEVADLTKRIFKYAKVKKPKTITVNVKVVQKSGQGQSGSGGGSGNGKQEGNGGQEGKTLSSGEMSDSDSGSGMTSGEKKEDEKEGEGAGSGSDENGKEQEKKVPDGKSEGGDKEDEQKASGAEDGENMPGAAKTADAMNDFAKKSVKKGGQGNAYFELPEPNVDMIVDDFPIVLKHAATYFKQYGNKSFNEVLDFKKSENVAISYMVKEFEMRKAADAYSRTKISKTGSLNTNKLHSYVFNDDLFKRNETVSSGKNHGFIMLLDWSGSMNSIIKETIKQLCTLAMFCRRVGVPFDVYLFRDLKGHDKSGKQFTYPSKNHVSFGDFKMRNILSSRMKEFEMNEAMKYLFMMCNGAGSSFDPMGSTPLNQSLFVMDKVVEKFRKKTGVQIMNVIVMTDGGANGHNYISGKGQKLKGNENYIINDNKFKVQHDAGGGGHTGDCGLGIFAKILKARTEANLLRFDLDSRPPYGLGADGLKLWKDEGFAMSVEPEQGFDVTFTVNPSMFKAIENEISEIKTDKLTAKTLTTQIIKQLARKTVSRVLLRRFIDHIIS